MAKTGSRNGKPERPLDRGVRPRPPRQRSEQRRVGHVGYRPVVTDVEDGPFDDNALSQLMDELFPTASAYATRGTRRPEIEQGLQDIAASFLRQREQHSPSRGEASYQLRMIAHLTFRLQQRINSGRSDELAKILGDLNPIAHMLLVSSCLQLDVRCPPEAGLTWEQVDPSGLGDAAALAWQCCTAGDYSDKDLFVVVLQLIELFRWATGKSPTYAAKENPDSAPSSDNTRSVIAGSHCGRFVLAFFKQLGTADRPETISNVLRRTLGARRKLASAQSLRREVPNIV